jgi:hypothetical protein
MADGKLRSAVNCQGVLKQEDIKQADLKQGLEAIITCKMQFFL